MVAVDINFQGILSPLLCNFTTQQNKFSLKELLFTLITDNTRSAWEGNVSTFLLILLMGDPPAEVAQVGPL